jgi:hypothetical protein
MGITAYTVLSEFKFDVGQAVLASDQLQGKVDQLSNSVHHAMESVKGFGINFAYQFTGGSTGILGLLSSAVNASDKFKLSQLSFTQIIDSNMQHLTGTIGTLNDKMKVSEKIMNDIGSDARKFGIPAAELLEMTKSLSAMLVPKGLAGENFKGARDLSRNLLKSAPNLGINPADVQGQLLRSIEGSASMGDTLFRRLLTEAPESFKEAKVGNAKQFNALDSAKRFGVLNKAMEKFASNSDLLNMRANTLSGVLQRVKDLFIGFTSVLKPIGDVLLPPLIEMMNFAIKWIDTKGRKLVQVMADFIKPLIENPKKLLTDLNQIKSLSSDFKTSAGLAGIAVTIFHIKEFLHVLKKIPVIGPFATRLGEMIANFKFGGGLLKAFNFLIGNMGKIFSFIWPIIKVAVSGILNFGAGLVAFLIPLQGLSRAITRMEIETIEWAGENIVELTEMMVRFKDVISRFWTPIQDMITGWEEIFFMIIGGTATLDFFKKVIGATLVELEDFSGGFTYMYATFRASIAGMFDTIFRFAENLGIIWDNLTSGRITNAMSGTKNIFAGYGEAFNDEFEKVMNKALSPTISDGNVDNSKVSQTVNKFDVKMTNNFKEVLQPDRIAFTITDQLKKASTFATQKAGSGGSLASRQAEAI